MNTISVWLDRLSRIGFDKAYVDIYGTITLKESEYIVVIKCDDYAFIDNKIIYFKDKSIKRGAMSIDQLPVGPFINKNLHSACLNQAFNPFYGYVNKDSSVLIDWSGSHIIHSEFEILMYGVSIKSDDNPLFLDNKLCQILLSDYSSELITVSKSEFESIYKVYTNNVKIFVKSSYPNLVTLDTNTIIERKLGKEFKDIDELVGFVGKISSLRKTSMFLPDKVAKVGDGVVMSYYNLSMTVFDWSRPNVPRETTI